MTGRKQRGARRVSEDVEQKNTSRWLKAINVFTDLQKTTSKSQYTISFIFQNTFWRIKHSFLPGLVQIHNLGILMGDMVIPPIGIVDIVVNTAVTLMCSMFLLIFTTFLYIFGHT